MKNYPACILLATFLSFPVITFAATPSVEAGFSPDGGAEQLVISTLENAHDSIRLMGYSFTSPEVVKALIMAKQRGVDVRVVVDEKWNRRKESQDAMNLVVNAGIPLRTNGQYKIMHDKVIVTDGENIEVGSFNYTRSAARYNSENALVVRGVPELARQYLEHWKSRWDGGIDWHSTW